jgi:hypothetical protein
MPNESHDKLNKLLSRQGSLNKRSELARGLTDDQLQTAAAAGIPQAKEELERRRHERLLAASTKPPGAPPEDRQAQDVPRNPFELFMRLARRWFGPHWEIIAAIGTGLCIVVGLYVANQPTRDFVRNLSRIFFSTVTPPSQVSPTSPQGLAPPPQSRATDKSEGKGNPPTTNEVSTPPEQKESRLSDAVFGDRWAVPQETPRQWGRAKEFAQAARINGLTGWRLPAASEMKSLFQSGDISSNSSLRTNCYWTADENGNYARVIFVSNGKTTRTTVEEKNSLCSIILIREYH